MCGLTGVVDFNGSATDLRTQVARMVAQIAHRGPDGEGVWAEDRVALGHRRLAILDLGPAGAQPMLSVCGRWVLAFNGEIYNHLDIRQELERRGAAPVWRGHSDTETLLAAMAHWGVEETLRRAMGMFAIALWDRRNKRLSLARDRMGEKPLYYGWAGKSFVFGSELKALRQHPAFPTAVCSGALAQYLRFAYVPAPRTIHPGVFKLEPGCILEIDGQAPGRPPGEPVRPGGSFGTLSIRRYWSLDEVIEQGGTSRFCDEGEALSALEDTLFRAVGRQMIADVPLGAFLSGGVDSSLIVALMQAQSSRPVKTFTIGFENPAFNEAPYAAAVARHLRSDHCEVMVTEREARDVIPSLPHFYDEPFADSSQIPTHLVCRAARANVTVALSGDGGDELFGGYNRYILGPGVWRRMSALPIPLRRLLAAGALAAPGGAWDLIGSAYNKIGPAGSGVTRLGDKVHRVADRMRRVKSVDDLHSNMISFWLDPHVLIADGGACPEPGSLLDDPFPSALDGDTAGRMMAQDMRTYLPDDILCKVDRAAMAVSLETRAPFLDPELVALSARLPADMKIREGRGKWALRQVLYRHVPRELIDRPKTGFGIPVGDWLRGPLKSWAGDLLSVGSLKRVGLLNSAPVTRAWEDHLSGRHDRTNQIWIVLMLQAWAMRSDVASTELAGKATGAGDDKINGGNLLV